MWEGALSVQKMHLAASLKGKKETTLYVWLFGNSKDAFLNGRAPENSADKVNDLSSISKIVKLYTFKTEMSI